MSSDDPQPKYLSGYMKCGKCGESSALSTSWWKPLWWWKRHRCAPKPIVLDDGNFLD